MPIQRMIQSKWCHGAGIEIASVLIVRGKTRGASGDSVFQDPRRSILHCPNQPAEARRLRQGANQIG